MSKDRGTRRRAPRSERALKAAWIGAAVAMAAPAAAFKIDTGSPDLELTLDTTLRYNAAVRTGERDLRLVNSPAVDEGNWLFGKNDTALSRFDLYTEFDFSYRKNMGFRVSAAGWYDTNFPDKSRSDPRFATVPNYARQRVHALHRPLLQGPLRRVHGCVRLGQRRLRRHLAEREGRPLRLAARRIPVRQRRQRVLFDGAQRRPQVGPEPGRLGQGNGAADRPGRRHLADQQRSSR